MSHFAYTKVSDKLGEGEDQLSRVLEKNSGKKQGVGIFCFWETMDSSLFTEEDGSDISLYNAYSTCMAGTPSNKEGPGKM